MRKVGPREITKVIGHQRERGDLLPLLIPQWQLIISADVCRVVGKTIASGSA
jgi:hypothetical protein